MVWTLLVAWTLGFQRSVYFSMRFGRSRTPWKNARFRTDWETEKKRPSKNTPTMLCLSLRIGKPNPYDVVCIVGRFANTKIQCEESVSSRSLAPLEKGPNFREKNNGTYEYATGDQQFPMLQKSVQTLV